MPNSNQQTPKKRISRAELDSIGVSAENVLVTLMPDDSMNMSKGDSIYIDTARKTIKDGNIYALEMDGYFYCKRLYKTLDGITLASDADGFNDITLNAQEAMEKGLKIIGWVFKWSHLELWETRMLLPPEQMEVSA